MKITINVIIILCLVIVLLVAFNNITILELIGIGLVAYIGYDLVFKMNIAFPIGHIALLIAGVQWIISPIVAYHSTKVLYPMAVSETEYLVKTLALYIPFIIGLLWVVPYNRFCIDKDSMIEFCCNHRRFIKALIVIGFIASIFPFNIPSLGFLLKLADGLFYVGVIMLCFSYPRRAVTISVFFMSYLLAHSIMGGMFHDLMVWGIFVLFVLFYLKEYKTKMRLVILFCLFIGISTLQAIKPVYRYYTWKGTYQGNKIELFTELFVHSLTGDLSAMEAGDINGRLNQGWIISRIYKRIPEEHPYLEGKTIWEGIESSLVPRMLSPNKKGAGKESIRDFTTFTGYKLNSKTSMGLSLLGEAYGNFGLLFGAIFMLLWGCFIGKLVSWIQKLSRKVPYWFFFLPLICFNLIKAEINFVSVLNWTVKAFLFTFIIIYIMQYYSHKSRCYQSFTAKNE